MNDTTTSTNDTQRRAAVSLTTGLEDAERVTVAFLVAVGAAESGRPTLMFLTKEAVRLGLPGVANAVACDGCPPLAELLERYQRAGGQMILCGVCIKAKGLAEEAFVEGARVAGTVQLWEWIGDGATAFSY